MDFNSLQKWTKVTYILVTNATDLRRCALFSFDASAKCKFSILIWSNILDGHILYVAVNGVHILWNMSRVYKTNCRAFHKCTSYDCREKPDE